MDVLPEYTQADAEQHLKQLENSINRKMSSQLPGLELATEQKAMLREFACRYAAEFTEAFKKRHFSPAPDVVRYIAHKAMHEAVV